MNIQAVSICVNYADYLESILQNRQHFDRWVIVTVAEDTETRELCRQNNLECIVSRVLRPDGSDFNPAYNKSRAINEGLAILDQHDWAVILDSDVLLPRYFRQRLKALPLDKRCIYGLKGRQVCPDRRTFEAYRHCQPWDAMFGRNTQPLGYFQLFHLGTSSNRYPELSQERTRVHDDDCFVQTYPPNARRCLPFSSLHAGPVEINWTSRIAGRYTPPSSASVHVELRRELAALVDDELGRGVTSAMIGYFPGNVAGDLGRRVKRLYLLDHHRIHRRSHHPLVEADRVILRRYLDEELAGLNTVFLGAPSVAAIETIPDQSLDCLYLSGGFSSVCETLVDSIPAWLRKLKQGAIICGDMFDPCVWQDGVTAISWFFGKPDHIAACGFWWKRLPTPTLHLHNRPKGGGSAADEGVCVANSDDQELEPLFLTMHSVREHWHGPIAVYHRGNVEDALRLACWRLGCELHSLSPANPHLSRDGRDLLAVAPIQPFQRGLLLRSGMLICNSIEPLFRSSGQEVNAPGVGPYLAVRSTETFYPIDPRHIAHGTTLNDSTTILLCDGDPETWTDAAWEHWTYQKTSMLSQMAVEIRVRPKASIVVVADLKSFGDLQQQWTGMKIPRGTPVILVLLDVPPEDAWLEGSSLPDQTLHFSSSDVTVPDLLLAIATACSTERLIFLPPTVAATPCAELFESGEWDRYQIVSHILSNAAAEPRVTGNVFVPVHFFGMACTAYLRGLAEEKKSRGIQAPNLSVFMHLAASEDPDACTSIDLSQFGWGVLKNRYQYVSSRFLSPASSFSTSDRRVLIRVP
jgi:hypothetical protein